MTRNPDTCRLNISTILQQQFDLTQQFETLLASEYQVIAERDTADFERVIADKKQLLEQLTRLEQERAAAQEAAGFDTGNGGMTDYLRWCDPQQQLNRLWQDLLAVARACHEQNRKNQQLVELCNRHAREALQLLRGEDPRQGLYQADGDTDNRHSSRSLVRV